SRAGRDGRRAPDPWAQTAATDRVAGGDPRRVVIGDPSGGRGDGPRHVRTDETDDGPRPKRSRSWVQRVVLTVGAVVVVVCLLGASVAAYALIKYGSIDRVGDLDHLASAPEGEPENFLIVAVDGRAGHETKNTDTIMVLRVDPSSDRVALTSFSRDLMVTIADTGELGMINSAFARDSGGEKNLTDTIQQNFGITINHYVQVNFDSFSDVVDAVGGVPLWFPYAARDRASGFFTDAHGACVNLDGEQGLAFVRSRKMDIMVGGDWERDPLSEVNRVKRQQIFIQRALADVLAEVKTNPLRMREMVDIGVSNVALDPNLGIGDILDLAERFKGFDPAQLETYPLPTVPWPEDENRLVLDDAAAEPMLNVFRGLPPGEISPGLVTVQVLNGTVADPAQQREGLATDVSGALQEVGFDLATPDDADTFYPKTTIEYAPGEATYAQRVARHITSTAAIPTAENPDVEPGTVRLIAGLDFTSIHQDATPIDAMPAAPGAPAPTPETGGGSEAPAETPSTTAPPATTTTTTNPYVIGATPEGQTC
ncbi:MAG TPA: LCP family protein, partial [Acidimicrobiales bacterium]|nr:LCP family protein [Acidimicrobiales bacterium]